MDAPTSPSPAINRYANWWFHTLSLPFYGLMYMYMRTLDARAVLYDPIVDPGYQAGLATKRIYTFWHDAITGPLYLRGRCHMTMLLSQHADAEYVCILGKRLGFDMIRGSTNRGGTQALRDMLRVGKESHLTFTVDGPRGPRYHFAFGTTFLASRSHMPIVPMGFAYRNPWRARRAWDRFAFPKPFSRLRAVIGPEVWIPPKAKSETLEHFRQKLETIQRQLTVLAEDWADSDEAYENEYTFGFGPDAVPRNDTIMQSSRAL